jgi:hypothetical protein
MLRPDRHHENWGVVVMTDEYGETSFSLAPTFDHASSLGRNESDDADDEGWLPRMSATRFKLMQQEPDRHSINPLHLSVRCCKGNPLCFPASVFNTTGNPINGDNS